MTDNPNAALVRRALRDGFLTGDFDVLTDAFADDITWHLSGANPLAGTYRGREAVFGYFAKIMELTAGTLRPVDRDTAGGDEHGVLLLHTTATRIGKRPLDIDEILVCRVVNGRMAEVHQFQYDRQAWDEFWS